MKINYDIIVLVFIFGFITWMCNKAPFRYDSNINEVVPIGYKLNTPLLRKAKQIYPYNDGLILLYKNKVGEFRSAYHLLFFDTSLHLKSTCYSTDKGIIAIRNRELFSIENPRDETHQALYKNGLPKGYRLTLFKYGSQGNGYKRNKIIDAIDLLHANSLDSLCFKLHYSEGKEFYYNDVEALLVEDDLKKDSITLSLKEIYISDSRTVIYNARIKSNGNYYKNQFFFNSAEQANQFYKIIYDLILRPN